MKAPIDMNESELRSSFDFSEPSRGRFQERYREGHTITLLDFDPDQDLDTGTSTDPNRTAPDRKDTQLTEIAGKHLLISRLISAGFEVAEPIRDKGIDLLVYSTTNDGERFISHPIQLKASSDESFSLDKKYEKLHGLLLTYVWHVEDPNKSEIYALSFDEAKFVLEQKGYAKTDSWTLGGYYFVRKADAKLKEMLKPYLMNPERWRQRLQAC